MIELSVVNDRPDNISAANPTIIKIIGCGGGGSSAVNHMIEAGIKDVEFIVLNTDLQALNISRAQKRLAIGQKLTGGLGAGGNPSVGENAAKEDTDSISNIVKGSDMIIITAGMGGGTGTGSAPVVASLAREAGALTIAVVTTPFCFEGPVRMKNANEGIRKLRESVDSLIVIPNEQILKVADKKLNFRQAFRLADDVLCQGVQGITEVITVPGEPNLDFADVKSVMKQQGDAILGVGFGDGETRALDAAQRAISNPMLQNTKIDGASKILINIAGDESLSVTEISDIVSDIRESAADNVELFFGVATKPDMGDTISVTVIATGFKKPEEEVAPTVVEQKPERKNVIEGGDFVKILRGEGVMQQGFGHKKEVPAEPEEKPLAVNMRQRPVAEETPKKEVNYDVDILEKKPASRGPLNTALQRASSGGGVRPSSTYPRNPDDYTQPAVWRNLKGLSRTINVSDDK